MLGWRGYIHKVIQVYVDAQAVDEQAKLGLDPSEGVFLRITPQEVGS
jgi:hypothetical protein